MVLYFGAHIGVSDDLLEDVKYLKKAGGNIIQIMLTIKGYRMVSKKKEPMLLELKKYLEKNNMKVVVHSSYTHNLAKNWDSHSWWLKNMELEIKYANMIGAIGLVVHFGKRLDLSISNAYNNMYSSLVYLHNKTKEFDNIKIFLETSSGQGTELCYKMEDLAHFYRKFSSSPNKELQKRIKLCIDTCHIFAAGYDIRNSICVRKYLEEFDELIGLHYVKLLHLNDSKVDLGEKKDRHANIGKGYIGYEGLKLMFNYFNKLDVPIILETPGCKYPKEIKLLKST